MVRLEGGVTSMEGVVSLCIGNKWRQVCDTYWTAADTKVVCGQLGYTGGQALLGFNYRSASSSYNLVNCRGNESVITDCALTASASMCASYAGVSCYISTYSALDNMSPALGGGVGGGILGVLVLLFLVCIGLYAYILYRRKRQAMAGYQQVSSQAYTESPGNILVQETSNNQPQSIMLLQPNNGPSVSTPQPALCCTPSPFIQPHHDTSFPQPQCTSARANFPSALQQK
eukprot:Em0001g149a